MLRGGATAYCSSFVCLLPAYSVARSKVSADTSNTGRNRYLLGTELIDIWF